MCRYIAETYITLQNASTFLEQICPPAALLCHSVIVSGQERKFKFEDGHAVGRATDDGIHLRITAKDILVFFGIQAMFETRLLELSYISTQRICWYPTTDTSFSDAAHLLRVSAKVRL